MFFLFISKLQWGQTFFHFYSDPGWLKEALIAADLSLIRLGSDPPQHVHHPPCDFSGDGAFLTLIFPFQCLQTRLVLYSSVLLSLKNVKWTNKWCFAVKNVHLSAGKKGHLDVKSDFDCSLIGFNQRGFFFF